MQVPQGFDVAIIAFGHTVCAVVCFVTSLSPSHILLSFFLSLSLWIASAATCFAHEAAIRYEMACGVELDAMELPASIPCAQPIIKLLKLIWSEPLPTNRCSSLSHAVVCMYSHQHPGLSPT